MNVISFVRKMVPGFLLSLLIAAAAVWIEGLLPIHLIGGSVIALFIGMFLNSRLHAPCLTEGVKFTSKKVLKFAIILLGASLNVQTVLTVGKMSLSVMCFTLLTCFGGDTSVERPLG